MDEEIEKTRKAINTQLLGIPEEKIPRVSLEGCEVVRRQYLSHIKESILTIRPDGIMFNNACIAKMEDVVYIQLLINRNKRMLVVRGCEENDKDSQRWCSVKDGVRKSRKITGREFATRVYAMMGWSKGYYYKICGTVALQENREDELLTVFELEECERYPLTTKGRKAAGVTDEELGSELAILKEAEAKREEEAAQKAKPGEKPKVKRPKGKYPEGWTQESFGVPVEEHQNRVDIQQLDLFDVGMLPPDRNEQS